MRWRRPRRSCFDALDTDLDRIAFVLDAPARAARSTFRCRGSQRAPSAPVPPAPRTRQRRADAAPRRSAERCRRRPRPARAATPSRRARGAVEATPARRRCCACAPTSIDRLVNEAGEVAISRARVEGELRALKAQPARAHQQRDPAAQPGARDRDPGRVADPVADAAAAGAPRRLRSARVRPLHALPGADALARRRRQRRVDGAAGAAEEPRRRRRRAARAGAAVARSAAAAVRDPHRAVRQPVRAPVPDPALDREGARQARQPRDRRRADRARPLGAGKARRSARAPAAQRARPRHRAARSAARGRQGRDRARSR